MAECGQLEEELMGMVSVRAKVSTESFNTLPLPALQLCAFWNLALLHLPLRVHMCVCVNVLLNHNIIQV